MLTEIKFSANEKVIAKIEAYFEIWEQLCYKNDIENLEGHYNRTPFSNAHSVYFYSLVTSLYILLEKQWENQKSSYPI